MSLLNPSALYLLAIVPALVLAYLARERPRQVVVSSVLAFRVLRVMRGERFGGRLRFSWPFFLELLILALAVLAIAGPYRVHEGNAMAVVLDNSAPMQVRTPDNRTRFAAALSKITDELNGASGSTTVTVYLTAPEPHPIGAAFPSPSAAHDALGRLQPLDAPGNPASLNSLLNQLNADRKLVKIVVATYRPVVAAGARIQALTIGQPTANYAIGSFDLARDSLGAVNLHGHLTVANFSNTAQMLKVTITADGKAATNQQAQLAPSDVVTLDLPNLPPAQIYHAQLEPADAFALDNEAYATASVVKNIGILLVSPVAADGESLKSIPGVVITTRTPETYTPSDLARSDVALFEYTIPKELPKANALFVMPPPGDQLFKFATAQASQLQVTGWSTIDPLTDGVNFRLLNLRSGEYFGQHPWLQAVVAGAHGGLILSGDREGHRYIVTGFNPLPYLGRQNLPMSILTLNLLSHLAGLGAPNRGYRTGEPWVIPSTVSAIVMPNGRRAKAISGGSFGDTDTQGVYRLVADDGTTLRAVNLADLTTSDLENVAPLKIEAAPAVRATEMASTQTPLAPYALAIILGLIALEAFFVYRGSRPMVDA